MRLATVRDPIQSSGLGASNNFSIAASAKAFDILSNNLYQNKILAVIREISCNAADAHKVVGAPYDTIEVHLPTFGEPWFSVRDYGPGLSNADVMQLYTTYFQSTKDNSDDLIGGFGLGSKSPFAVADQFTVTSWHGGFKSEYVMYKDAGLPRVNLIRSTPSSERTGLHVQVPTSKDFSTWVAEACNFFSWWETRPTITPASVTITPFFNASTVTSPTLINGKPAWYKGTTTNAACIALVGLVPYAVDFTAIPNCNVRLRNIVLPFDVGEVQPSPSRETLSYDPATCANILKRATLVSTELMKTLKDKFNNAKSFYEARLLYNTLWRNRTLQDIEQVTGSNVNLSWHGQHIKSTAEHTLTSPVYATLFERTWRSKKWRKMATQLLVIRHGFDYYWTGDYRTLTHRTLYVWVSNVTARTYTTIQHHMDTTYPHCDTCYVIVGGNFNALQTDLDTAGFPPLMDASNWAPPPKAPRKPRTKTPAITKGYTFDIASGNYARTESDIDLTGGGIYVTFYNGQAADELSPLRTAMRHNLAAVTKVAGFRRAQLQTAKFAKALDTNGWIAYKPDSWWADFVDPAKLVDTIQGTLTADIMGQTYPVLVSFMRGMQSAKKLALLKPEFSFIESLGTKALTPNTLTYSGYERFVWSQAQKDAVTARQATIRSLFQKWNALVQAKPLITHIQWEARGLDFQAAIDYINS